MAISGLDKISELGMGDSVVVYQAGTTAVNGTDSGSHPSTLPKPKTCYVGSPDTFTAKVAIPDSAAMDEIAKATSSDVPAASAHTPTPPCTPRAVTNGGRVLAVTGLGSTLRSAVSTAYRGVKTVHFEGMHYRTDIARR